MTDIPQSVAWWCFVPRMMTAEAFIHCVAEIGYDAIDLVPRDYWPMVRQAGLQISAVAGHQSLEVGLNRRDQHTRITAEILQLLDDAVRWQIPQLICFSGNRTTPDDHVGLDATIEGLQYVAEAAQQAQVTLVLELLNSKVNHPDYQADHTAWGVEVCERVQSPAVKLLYDIYHMQIMEGDIIRTIQAHHQWIGHYHTAGNPGRHEPFGLQELYYPAILQAIRETGYGGYICHEFIPTVDPIVALRETFEQSVYWLKQAPAG